MLIDWLGVVAVFVGVLWAVCVIIDTTEVDEE